MKNWYVASKFHHAPMWKALFKSWSRDLPIRICARWVNDYHELVPDHPQFCKIGWKHDVEDVKASDGLILYVESGEHLRGALVEVGIALANRKPVIIIGDHPDYGTWQFHELVYKVETLEDAKILIQLFQLGTGDKAW